MNTLQLSRTHQLSEDCGPELRHIGENSNESAEGEGLLDLATIRRRVALIKNRWSAETVRARAIEGARRRIELEGLVANVLAHDNDDVEGEECGLRLFL